MELYKSSNDPHEKLLYAIQTMLIDVQVNLPYYGEFNLFINFFEQESIGTCGVNVTSKGMNFMYSPTFLNELSQKEVNFVDIHEIFHLLFNHPKRTITGIYEHQLSNVAQDMIINHAIWSDISHNFVEIPKDKNGKNMALFVPKDYNGKLIFEELYEWLKEEKDKWKKKQDEKKKSGDQDDDQDDEKNYGPYGKKPSDDPNSKNETIDTWSKEKIFEDLENGNGEYLDKHIEDDIPEEMREGIVKEIMDKLASRGLSSGDVEKTLNKLRKKRKDYLKEIKRKMSNMIFGTIKNKTIQRPNRRQIEGLKGNRKVKQKINLGLDTSGSMGGQGTFERVLSYVYRSDIEMNFMESDTKVNWVQNIKNKRQLQSIPIKGLGGTALQPMIDHIVENFNEFNTVLLTDGYTDTLDLSRLKGKILIISVGTKCPIGRSNGKLKQIVLDPGEK